MRDVSEQEGGTLRSTQVSSIQVLQNINTTVLTSLGKSWSFSQILIGPIPFRFNLLFMFTFHPSSAAQHTHTHTNPLALNQIASVGTLSLRLWLHRIPGLQESPFSSAEAGKGLCGRNVQPAKGRSPVSLQSYLYNQIELYKKYHWSLSLTLTPSKHSPVVYDVHNFLFDMWNYKQT